MRGLNRKNLVMVADDDMFVRKVIINALRDFAQVIEVDTGDQVVSRYKEHIPDLIFLDIHLPKKSGLKILPELLMVDPEAYIVMLSADSSPENVTQTSHQGIKGFLTKPFSMDRISRHLQRCPTVRFLD